jgi:hypothetical protein
LRCGMKKKDAFGWILLCLACTLVCGGTVLGQLEAGNPTPVHAESRVKDARKRFAVGQVPRSVEKILTALDEDTRLEFIETPLNDVVNFLKELHGIEIELDVGALADVAIDNDTPITKNLKGISLRSALRLMLADLQLTYVIKNEVLLITTIEQAEEMMATRVYDTRLLKNVSAEKLVQLLTTMVSPSEWQEKGGEGRVASITGGLVVYQNELVHGEIVDLLRQLSAHQENSSVTD